MAAIILDSDKHDIADLIRYLDGDHHMGVYDRAQVVEDLKAQLPTPAIEEPKEFGSVVMAGVDGLSDRVHWVRCGGFWFTPGMSRAGFEDLHHPEVLRVGIGETYPHASGDAVVLGPETIRSPKGTVITHKGENYYPLARGAV